MPRGGFADVTPESKLPASVLARAGSGGLGRRHRHGRRPRSRRRAARRTSARPAQQRRRHVHAARPVSPRSRAPAASSGPTWTARACRTPRSSTKRGARPRVPQPARRSVSARRRCRAVDGRAVAIAALDDPAASIFDLIVLGGDGAISRLARDSRDAHVEGDAAGRASSRRPDWRRPCRTPAHRRSRQQRRRGSDRRRLRPPRASCSADPADRSPRCQRRCRSA